MLASAAWCWLANLVAIPAAALGSAAAPPPVVAITQPAASSHPHGEARAWFGSPEAEGVSLSWSVAHPDRRLGWVAYAEQARGFAQSRTPGVEVAGVPREAVPLARALARGSGLALRGGWSLPLEREVFVEAGASVTEGGATLADLGRRELGSALREWGRLRVSSSESSAHFFYDGDQAREETDLWTGSQRDLGATRLALGGEVARMFRADRLELRLGADLVRRSAHGTEGAVLPRSARTTKGTFFGQARWRAGGRLAATAGLRWADLPATSAQWSPRLGLALALAPSQRVSASYTEVLVEPSLEQRALVSAIAPPLDLGRLERAFGLDLGFSSVPLLATGNRLLEPEKTRRWEIGYRGSWGPRIDLNVVVWRAFHENLISGYLPGGHPDFPAYRLPEGVAPEAGALFLETLRAVLSPTLLAALSNLADGDAVAVFSPQNAGRARSEGAAVTLQGRLGTRLSTRFFYALLDFDVDREALGDPLLPNAPPHRAALDLRYSGSRLTAFLGARWQASFAWVSGPFRGQVPRFEVVDVGADLEVAAGWTVALSVENALDRRYYDAFGGDIFGRQVRGTIRVRR